MQVKGPARASQFLPRFQAGVQFACSCGRVPAAQELAAGQKSDLLQITIEAMRAQQIQVMRFCVSLPPDFEPIISAKGTPCFDLARPLRVYYSGTKGGTLSDLGAQ